ncbi:MAG TPA: class A beta-lactamase-related serine hydrolase, partial [Armatimonadetes bacterium]|nr:class A beta-lactamase-related serine hydrolase [Armatimonadota bacterium]
MCYVGVLLTATLAFQWLEAKPEDVGMSSRKLERMCRALREEAKLNALVVIRHDRIVYEWYGSNYGRHVHHHTASLAKALIGGVTLIMGLGDERLKLNDYVWKYVPQWRTHPLKSKITIFHLATHSSGLEDSTPRTRGTWKEQFWKYPHHYRIARDVAPVLFEPGTKFHYSNTGMAMLAYCIAGAYK